MQNKENIRNFSIIAHIDHGKSTLADRMLETTKTVEKRKMKDRILDQMELEQERGITIKMQPVRMEWTSRDDKKFIFNLIDTPGHVDFSYEVSRALKAVEGAVLLVDATQGIQAQTLTVLAMARKLGLTIVPAVSKVDSQYARTEEVKKSVADLLECNVDDVIEVSGKTGHGVEELLTTVSEKIDSPQEGKDDDDLKALIFDFKYSNHRGIIVYIRIMNGSLKKRDSLKFAVANTTFNALEVGIFSPDEVPVDSLGAGEIGYIVTGIKKPGVVTVGDTVMSAKSTSEPLPGYMSPQPIVWASVYPENPDDFTELRQSLDRLQLTDSSLSYEEEASGVLGKGFRCGFLGMLHLEIIIERLKREFGMELIVTTPSITYEILKKNGDREVIYSPIHFPNDGSVDKVFEPWVDAKIISPSEYIGTLMQVFFEHEAEVGDSEVLPDNRSSIEITMPLRELMRGFFDRLKSASSGYASIAYEMGEMKEADVVRLDILVADEMIPAFSRIVSKRRAQEDAEKTVAKLAETLPRQMFVAKIQAKAMSRILSSKTLKAMRKDVTSGLYGGDITRKKKLLEKQKKGKKKMRARGKVNIPHDIFIKMMKE